METTTTAKGQIVIPASIRRRLGIKEGTRIKIEERDNEIILRQLHENTFTAGEESSEGKA
jgi:AbrB family looped-hinge helix DNA binding protein